MQRLVYPQWAVDQRYFIANPCEREDLRCQDRRRVETKAVECNLDGVH